MVAASLKASRIRVVDLSRNAISDRGAAQLADESERCATLSLLTIQGCRVEHELILRLEAIFNMGTDAREELAAKRIAGDVKIPCKYGCDQGTTINEKEDHEARQCHLRYVQCPFKCTATLRAHHEADHCIVCPKRPVTCSHKGCDHACTLGDLPQHESTCPLGPVVCPNNCSILVVRGELSTHVVSECPKRIVACEYPGCDARMTADAVDEHERRAHRSKYATYTAGRRSDRPKAEK